MDPSNILTLLKRWRFAVLAFVLLALALYWALCYRQRAYVLDAIPEQTAVVFSFPGFKQLNTALSEMPKDLKSLSLLRVLQEDIRTGLRFFQIDSTLPTNTAIRDIAAGFSLQQTDNSHPVIILDMDQRQAPADWISRIKSRPGSVISNFKGHTIYAIRNGGEDQFVVARLQNLLIFSKYSYLVEDALLQANSPEQWWAKSLGVTVSENKSLEIGFRPELVAERCRGEMATLWQDLPNWLSEQVEWLSIRLEGKQWKATIQARKNMRSGYGGGVTTDAISAILPDNTAFFLWAGYENSIDFHDLAPGANAGSDYRSFVAPWIGKEAAFVLIDPNSPGMQEDQFLVFSCLNEALAHSRLKAFGDQTGVVKKYNYQTYEIRQFLSQSLIAPLLSKNRPAFVNPVCAVINGYVVFAASTSAIELWIDKYIVSQTLGNQPDYLLNKQKLPGKGNLHLYLNANYLPQLVQQLFQPSFFEKHTEDIRLLQSNGLFGCALQSDRRGEIQGVLSSQRLSNTAQDVSILWKTTLNAPAITTPFVVNLSAENSEHSILIQDSQFQLYRISANGSIQWRKQLDQAIISPVHGIDFYKNGKICYLFNTADAVWLLDDEGMELVGYPLHLQSPATNGVAVVDFDNDRNYRYFIACQNGNLYGFDQFGRPSPGWNSQSGVGRIKHPLIHFKQGDKDYLAALNLSGKLLVFNRNGAEHFPAIQLSGRFVNNPAQFDAGKESPRIVCANDEGRVFVCNLSGQNFALDLSAGASTRLHSFVFEPLFGDSRKDYAMLGGNTLSVSGYEGNSFQKKYTAIFPVQPDTLFRAGCCGRLGALSRDKRQIYLMDAQGKICPGFPLAGTTPFVLKQPVQTSLEQVLIVGNMDALYAYKIRE